MLIYLISIIIFSVVMALATNSVVEATKKLSSSTGLTKYALAGLILALGTSLPEFLVAILSAINKQSILSLGNVIGSNIANLSIIIGVATIIGGNLRVNKNILKNDIFYSFLISAAPLILLIDGQLSRLDGLFLVILWISWGLLALSQKSSRRFKEKVSVLSTIKKRVTGKSRARLTSNLVNLIVSLALLVTASHLLVKNASFLAGEFGLSPLIIGIFLVGLGTSLPELALESKAIKNKESAVALGDLLGSVVVNSSLIIGVSALIDPVILSQPRIYLITTVFFLITFLVFYLFIKSKNILERWEGAILLMLYFLMVAVELV